MSSNRKDPVDRAAAHLAKAEEAKSNWALHEAERLAVQEKTARLRALRLARDAARAEAKDDKKPKPPKRGIKTPSR